MTASSTGVVPLTAAIEHSLAGASEMAGRMRSLDWAATPLGPVATWPQSLRTSVSICLDCAFPIVLWWGPQLAILYNDEYTQVLGAKHPSALGQPCSQVWTEIWDVIEPMLAQVMERGEATRSRDLQLHMNRKGYLEETYFSFSYGPIYDEYGKVGGVFCPCIETTEKVVGERRLVTLRDLAAQCKGAESEQAVYQAAAAVLAANARDVPFALLFRIADDAATAYLDAVVGIERGVSNAAPPHVALGGPDDLWGLGEVVRSGKATARERLADRFDVLPTGAWAVPSHTAMVLPVQLPGQDRPRAILVAGVSPMRALDDSYRTFFGLLAMQIASGLADAQAIEEERRRAAALAEIDRAKTAFFSNVSHEFRTPLTLMLGPLADLLANAHGVLPAGVVEQLTLAHRNSLRLQKLVNSLLDFARIEAGRVEASYEPTDLAAATAELASVFRSAVEKAGLALAVECEPLAEPVYVDRDMWEKIVLNLLSNAFKFTFEGEIRVTLRANGERVELCVSDTGVGIADADLPNLFQRFQRVRNARSRTHEGSGIGLALVRELVKLHGGDVGVASREHVGTAFTVSLPKGKKHLAAERVGAVRQLASTRLGARAFLQEALRASPNQNSGGYAGDNVLELASRQAAMGKRARIVLADDNADMRDYVRSLLARDYEVVAVDDGQAALEAIRAELPNLVLTDVMMPRLDGFGLVAAIRADERTRSLPVIVLSARAGEEARIEGLGAGADDYLIKPFSARELLARVASQLALAAQRGELEHALRYGREQVEILLDAAPIGIYLIGSDFRIRSVNPIARRAFGAVPGAIEGLDFEEVMRQMREKSYADEIVRIFRHTLATGEPYLQHKHAVVRPGRDVVEYFEWRLERITLPDGERGLVCYFRDISAHVAAQQALEESREALKEADRRKDEFLAMLAHELRTPLAPIHNALQILRLAGKDGVVARNVQDMMERQVNQMVRLVDDLMEVSRITRGKLDLRKQRADLAAIVGSAVETTRPLIDAAQHFLTVDLGTEQLELDGDPVRLAQVFGNLLSNAAKYTPNGGQIALRAERHGFDVTVSVRDNGAGIRSDVLSKIFEPFVQAERTYNRSQGGLGIGLTLARSIVALHGGTIEAQSAGPGLGSEFVVRLPLLQRPALATGTVPAKNVTRITGQRILVVDDNVDAAETLSALLRCLGADVLTVHDGPTALECMRIHKPSAAVLDIGMPGMDGYEVARRTRAEPNGAELLLIALTGWGNEEDRRRSREAGIDHHLVKPVELEVLESLLAARHARQPADRRV
jgi:PAS domain S-box-containing protein